MSPCVLIAHAEGEEEIAEKIAKPLRDVGYDVVHHGTVIVGESIPEETSKVLNSGAPVVFCGTIKAVGTRVARRTVYAAQQNDQTRIFVVQMEKEADVEQLSFGTQILRYWKNPEKAVRDLIAALKEYYPLASQTEEKEAIFRWNALRSRIETQLENQLRLIGYDPEKDVRERPEWPEDFPILILTGESGQGKTWQLCNLALNASLEGRLVILISEEDKPKGYLSSAANTIWQEGLDENSTLSIDALARRIQDRFPTFPEPWLTLCINDVHPTSKVRELIKQNWEGRKTRLAVTTSSVVGQALDSPERIQYSETSDSSRSFLSKVRNFTDEELRDFCQRQKREWGVIPKNVREVLRTPLFAKFYCAIGTDSTWKPTKEYELFESYWDLIQTAGDQVSYPEDPSRMRQLAFQILEPKSIYPWRRDALQKANINEEAQKRLESIGWLRRLEGGVLPAKLLDISLVGLHPSRASRCVLGASSRRASSLFAACAADRIFTGARRSPGERNPEKERDRARWTVQKK